MSDAKTGSSKSALYAHLRDAVLTLTLAPGADLDEAALARDFGLSRTPLREVFRQLAGEGYLELRANRSARVSEMSYQTLRGFFLAAPMIYEAVQRLAALNATPAQVDALRAAQDRFREALRNGTAADRALANTDFHEITGEMAGNVYLLPSFRRLLIDHARISMTFYRPQNTAEADRLNEAAGQHDAIIEAIAASDTERAGALAEAHWRLSRDQIERFVIPQALDVPLGSVSRKGVA